MLAQERIERILELINDQGFVKVEELAQQFGVSEMTVRRDLEKCRKSGAIVRLHGGASLKSENEHEQHYDAKSNTNQQSKRNIANYCAALVREGSTVFLDTGTTTYQIAERLCRIRDLTIVTNDILIAGMLFRRASHTGVRIIVIGGEMQEGTGSTLGPFAERMLSEIRVDISFIGAASIDTDYNIMTPTIEKAFLKRLATGISGKSYLVADASKFSRRAMVRINNLSDYTAVVTDKIFTPEEQKGIREKRINIISIPNEEGQEL